MRGEEDCEHTDRERRRRSKEEKRVKGQGWIEKGRVVLGE